MPFNSITLVNDNEHLIKKYKIAKGKTEYLNYKGFWKAKLKL